MLPKSLVILRVIVTRSPAALLSISYVHHGPNGSDIYMVLFEEGDFLFVVLSSGLHYTAIVQSLWHKN